MDSSIYTYVARLRRILEPGRPLRAPSTLLAHHGAGYALHLGTDQVDALMFDDQLEHARHLAATGQFCAAVAELDTALALWKGPALGGAVGPFAEAARLRLTEQRFSARQERAECLLNLGRPADVIAELSELVRWQPLRERLRQLRMIAFYRLGRRADALAEFREIRCLLITELGIEPSDDLQRCHQQILRSDPDLDALPVGRRYLDGSVDPPVVPAAPAQLPRDTPGFTGRAAELQRLHALVQEAEAAGDAAVIMIDGGPATGKSALAVHLAHEVSGRFPDGHLYLDLAGTGQPASVGSAVARLMADLGDHRALPATADRQAAMFRSAVWGRRMLIVLDDAASTAQVRALLPGSPSCVVLVTSRAKLSGLAAREGAGGITLGPMPTDDAVSLVRHSLGLDENDHTDDPVIRELVRACSRLPLALRVAAERVLSQPGRPVTEAIRELLDRESPLDRVESSDPASSIRAVFATSYAALPGPAAELLRLLGVHGGTEISLAAVSAMANIHPTRSRSLLHTLVEARLIDHAGPDRFRLTGLMHAYAAERAITEDAPARRSELARRMLVFYLGHAASALRALGLSGAGQPSCGLPRVPIDDPDQARHWLHAETGNVLAAVAAGHLHGQPELAQRLRELIEPGPRPIAWPTAGLPRRPAICADPDWSAVTPVVPTERAGGRRRSATAPRQLAPTDEHEPAGARPEKRNLLGKI
ncbi:AfsR/SARP family transcriptional regulator [Micromonospora zhanjiangensis]